MQDGLTRRRFAAGAALAAALPGHAAVDPFAALRRAALPVRQPARALLLHAAAAAGRIVAVGERGVVALSDDGAKRWRQARRVPVSVTLTAVRFADAKRGWAVGHGGVILTSADGGETWDLQADGRTLAAAAERAAAAQPDLAREAALLVRDGPDKPLFDLHIAGPRRLFVIGAFNLAFESADGGASWSAASGRIDNPKAQHLYALAARGSSWLIAGEQGLLLRSPDGGRSFQRLASPYAGTFFVALATDAGEWIVAGLRGNAFRSADDGQTWRKLEGAPPAGFVSACPLPGGGVLLANQSGQLFVVQAGVDALQPLPGASLPPLAFAMPLPSGSGDPGDPGAPRQPAGDTLALTFAGALRLRGGKPA
ncbi:MAG: hypothetical protein LCI02_10205 [Proteobacteria bacterium]|nr:hypothetical protein [Pseudomonadota bacterium]